MLHLVRVLLLAAVCGMSWTSHAVAAAPSTCPRPSAGAVVVPPPDIYGRYGVLRLSLNYDTRTDDEGRTLFCFETPDGLESPTLHVQPGDTLDITLTNRVPQSPAGPAGRRVMDMPMSGACGDAEMTESSVNIHFHGMNIAPTCHSDEVLHTVVNPGAAFIICSEFQRTSRRGCTGIIRIFTAFRRKRCSAARPASSWWTESRVCSLK